MIHRLLSWIPQYKLDWGYLSKNPAAIHLLEANQDKIHWGCLSQNPAAIHLLKANRDKIDWGYLSLNPAAIHLLEANQDKIDWGCLSSNPAIFELDYQMMSFERSALIKDELLAIALRPERVAQWHNSGHDIQFC